METGRGPYAESASTQSTGDRQPPASASRPCFLKFKCHAGPTGKHPAMFKSGRSLQRAAGRGAFQAPLLLHPVLPVCCICLASSRQGWSRLEGLPLASLGSGSIGIWRCLRFCVEGPGPFNQIKLGPRHQKLLEFVPKIGGPAQLQFREE